MRYYDAHSHLHFAEFDRDRPKIERQLVALPMAGAVVNGTNQEDWPSVLSLAQRLPWVRPSLGLHPWDVGNRGPAWAETLRQLLQAHPAAQVGEIGLDRWILDRARPDDPRLTGLRRAPLEEQREVFRTQLHLAAELGRAASVHCLDAWGALVEDLRATALPTPGFLLHAYGGPADLVPVFTQLGAYFSFNAYFLAENKEARRAVFRDVPRDRLLLETDAPAMPPPTAWRTHKLPRHRGTELNHPGNLEAAYTGLAAYLGESARELSQQVEANFLRLFGRG